IISSVHCGSIERSIAGRRSSRLAGAVPLLLKPINSRFGFILQRPIPIYELDMNSGNAVGAGAARANRRMRGDAILLAGQTDETTLRYLQRCEKCGAAGADVFSYRLFVFNNLTVRVQNFESHIDSDVVARRGALINKWSQ